MTIDLCLQNCSDANDIPDQAQLFKWIETVLQDRLDDIEMGIRIVDEIESAKLNQQYRQKAGPTNVLSFPMDSPPEIKPRLLGDLVICAPVVAKEAEQQNKTLEAHYAHLTIHGLLHLLGYDHIKDDQAQIMEATEIGIMHRLGYPNPYA